ncbi:hypothetical protein WJX74_002295 [Apatococcus lobatus]|uniref:Uncharacterized protein n=1 Tax=Apatococcus lobatus TaxID=904363 RepID=A0AAW1S6K9_9CHLO
MNVISRVENKSKLKQVSDASGMKQQLTAKAFEKSAGCKEKNAEPSIYVSVDTGAITLKEFDRQLAARLARSIIAS